MYVNGRISVLQLGVLLLQPDSPANPSGVFGIPPISV